MWAVLRFRLYLESTRSTIRIDHDSLKWNLNLTDASGRLVGWRVRLSESDFNVVHKAGVEHETTDKLSELRSGGEGMCHLDDDLPVSNVKNIPVTNDERLYVNLSTECDVRNDLKTKKPYEDPIKK